MPLARPDAAVEVVLGVDIGGTNTALGEMRFGAARCLRDFMIITLGTGLGSGIVVNGELVYGSTGFAGEVGHVIVELKRPPRDLRLGHGPPTHGSGAPGDGLRSLGGPGDSLRAALRKGDLRRCQKG